MGNLLQTHAVNDSILALLIQEKPHEKQGETRTEGEPRQAEKDRTQRMRRSADSVTFKDALGEHGGRSNMSLIYRPPLCGNLFSRYSLFILIDKENKQRKG